MNKNDLIASVADSTGLPKKDAAIAVEGVLDAITNALKDGSEVRLVGFGTFSVSERAATKGRDPRTGATIDIAASRQAKFRASKGLKSALA
ncbi:MAG: HU family DNA-binding protein [Hyphomicrobiales bacterium]|nr:HU family DNA-binding protein [Hyphomicrobiales bacterium]